MSIDIESPLCVVLFLSMVSLNDHVIHESNSACYCLTDSHLDTGGSLEAPG